MCLQNLNILYCHLYDQAWRSNDNLIKFKDGLMFLNVLPTRVNITYRDNERIILKTINNLSYIIDF